MIARSTKYILIPISVLRFYSCSSVHFDYPMPANSKSEKVIDSSLVGSYTLEDSTIINKGVVVYNLKYIDRVVSNMDSCQFISSRVTIDKYKVYYNLRLKTCYRANLVDSVRLMKKHRKEKKTYYKDYLCFELAGEDTILNLRKKDVVKQKSGINYLNHFYEKNNWEIFKVEKNKEFLLIGITDSTDEKYLARNLIKRKGLFGKIAHLSDPEFEKFVRKGGFRSTYKFVKAK